MKFTIGCDPEIFLFDGKSFKSAIGLIGGDKNKPRQITKDGHAILEDNVAVEFNIPACDSFETFAKEINFTMQKIKEIIPNHMEFSKESAVSFPAEELNCDAAWLFGCEPDYNAWTNQINLKPMAGDPQLRSCGGHIHVGSSVAKCDPSSVIRAMDLFLGIPSIILDAGELRKQLYGKAGAYRIKPYGVEYRTLSNFWIFSDSLMKWAYEGTQRALKFVEDGNTIDEDHGRLIQDCINNSDKNTYEYLAKTYCL